MSQAPEGWYDDGTGRLRYWDGSRWQDGPLVPPPTPQGPAAPASYAPPQSYPYSAPASGVAPYAQPGYPVSQRRQSGIGVAGFVVGLVSVFLPLFLGFLGGAAGLVLSIVSLVKHDAVVNTGRGLAVAGLVLSVVAIVFIL